MAKDIIKLTSVFHVCSVIDDEFHHNIVKVAVDSLWRSSMSITGQMHEKLLQ